VARELWLTRDRIAAERDVSPGRLVPDASLVAAVAANPESKAALAKVKAFNGRASRTLLDEWWAAMERGRNATDLPALRVKTNELPPARSWSDRNPEAAARLVAFRAVLQERADALLLPVENLLTPSLLRSLAWDPPQPFDVHNVSRVLNEGGAREWQVENCAAALAAAWPELEPESASH
jgi:ribonuclease D